MSVTSEGMSAVRAPWTLCWKQPERQELHPPSQTEIQILGSWGPLGQTVLAKLLFQVVFSLSQPVVF